MPRRAFYGVASSAATRNDRGTSRKISEEEVEKKKRWKKEKKTNKKMKRKKKKVREKEKLENMVILLPPFTCSLSFFP